MLKLLTKIMKKIIRFEKQRKKKMDLKAKIITQKFSGKIKKSVIKNFWKYTKY